MPSKRFNWFPSAEDISYGITLSKHLNRTIRLMRKQISDWPRAEERWAFEIALRKAYARRRYYKRLYGKNRTLWGR